MDKFAVPELPFTRRNWVLFAFGLVTIALGYVLLSIPPAEGFLSLTLAPFLLVVGYCVVIPVAILIRETPEEDGLPRLPGRGQAPAPSGKAR